MCHHCHQACCLCRREADEYEPPSLFVWFMRLVFAAVFVWLLAQLMDQVIKPPKYMRDAAMYEEMRKEMETWPEAPRVGAIRE